MKVKNFLPVALLLMLLVVLGSCEMFGESEEDSSSSDSDTTNTSDDTTDVSDDSTNSLGWDFKLTSSSYAGSSDWSSAVEGEFGSSFEVADWNDLKEYHSNENDILSLFDSIGLTEVDNSAFVTYNGDKTYYSSRYYFAARHEGSVPSSFMTHANIDNNAVSLGSWDSTKKIIAVDKSGTTDDSTNTNESDTSDSSFSGFSIGSLSDGGSTSNRTQYVSSTVPNPNSTSTSSYNGSVRVYVNSSYTSATPSYDSTDGWVISDHPITLSAGENTIYIAVYDSYGSLYVESSTWTITGNFDQNPYRVELTWDTNSNDLDLHLVKDDIWDSSNHCYWSNPTTGFSELDYDNTNGYGPENITMLNSVSAGEYDVYVKYYSGSVTVDATVKIFENGALIRTETHTFYSSDVNQNDNSYNSSTDWHVGTISVY